MDAKEKSGWTVVAGGVLMMLMLGVTYTWSVFKDPLVAKFGWSQTEVQLAFSIMLAVFAAAMIPAGILNDRKGPRLVALAGGILLGLGFIATSYFASSPLMLYITYGVLVGAGVGLAYGMPLAAGIKWFPQKRGLVSGIVMFGFGFGSLLLAPVAAWLIGAQGIMGAFLYLGIAFAVIISIGAMLLRNPPVEKAKGKAKAAVKAADFSAMEALRTGSFWMLWLMFMFAAAAGLMVIGNLATFAKLSFTTQHGMSVEAAASLGALAVGVIAVFNGLGRILAGWASDRMGRTKVMLVVFALQALFVACVVFVSGLSPWALFALMALIGVCFGANFSLFPATSADYFGTKNAGVNYGMLFTAYGVGGIIGPLAMAYVLDAAKAAKGSLAVGDYMLPFIAIGGLVGVAAIISLFTKSPRAK